MRLFEYLGKDANNSRDLGDSGLFEIKSDKVRIYFKYAKNRIIILGFVTLKKTQKAPQRYIAQAVRDIERFLEINRELL